MTDHQPIQRAIISVSDKTGLIAFAQRLLKHQIQLISTGGTARTLEQAGIPVTPIDQITGLPEMMDGRVKTLHPKVHGALLALRDHPEHLQAMSDHGIAPIDLICVNLYPFEKTIAKPDVSPDEAIEQIDIGGPSMIRSAAKNHRFVTVVVDPNQYNSVADDLDAHNGQTSLTLRTQLAAKAFARTAAYDSTIATWMGNHAQTDDCHFPDPFIIGGRLLTQLRYGENPHQPAAVYALTGSDHPSVATAKQLHGKQLSYNNLNDAAAALDLVQEFDSPAAAVIKHANPCGCAVGDQLVQAFERAYRGDPLAAFGGIVALNRTVDLPTAKAITATTDQAGPKFLEVVVAPAYDDDALEILRQRWKNVRLLATGDLHSPHPPHGDGAVSTIQLRTITGAILAQQPDQVDMSPTNWQHAAGPAPSQDITQSLHVAWCAVKHVKSNAIVIAQDAAVVGVGAGQMDRVQSCKIAVAKANACDTNRSEGAVAASDAFFPFRDGPDVLINAGVKAIVQPGGSKRDDETIAACNEAKVSLLFTGRRHFRH